MKNNIEITKVIDIVLLALASAVLMAITQIVIYFAL